MTSSLMLSLNLIAVNMEEFKLRMINKAFLYDGKDNFLKRGKKKLAINYTEQSEDEALEVYRTARTPETLKP